MNHVSIQLPSPLYVEIYLRYGDRTNDTIMERLAELAGNAATLETGMYPRPRPGTITGRVWDIADELLQETGTAKREAVVQICLRENINVNTASTQFSHWNKAHRARTRTITDTTGVEATTLALRNEDQEKPNRQDQYLEPTMTCREEILESARYLAQLAGTGEFTLAGVVQHMLDRGTHYKESTIRTHVTSRMCANAPDNHEVTYRDLERTAHGTYKLSRI